ncbi:MAG: putative N-acetyl-LL-diaminopimelate aminotransferase [Promethearchaeota archaeon]|nr:MAG: putative N-acetyl-LL-diaminopimelate aminotransferase [Candidatus Lokiarchaeota archaeon]
MTDFEMLSKTTLYKAFSELGKRIFLPNGIFYWSDRAKKEAEIKATIGAAYALEKDFASAGESKWVPSYLEIVKNYVNKDIEKLVPYASVDGLQELRKLWKMWIIKKAAYQESEKKNYLTQYISDPIVTAGLTNALFIVLSLFLDKNEKIILPNKRWGNYDNIIKRLIGADIKSFDFFENDTLNLNGLGTAIDEISEDQEKILLLLNFPNNPTGFVPTVDEIKKLVNYIKKKQNELNIPFIIIIDDAYEPYIYTKNSMKHSIFYEFQQLEEEIIPIKLDAITKEMLLYGGRIGFITFGLKQTWVKNEDEVNRLKAELDNKLKGMIRSTISNCNRFYQNLVINLLENHKFEEIVRNRNNTVSLLKSRFEKINFELAKIRNDLFSIDPNGGGFFLFINLDPTKIKATEFADLLLSKYKVGVIPFENPQENVNGIRIAYCSVDIQDISELIKRINSAFQEY